ncbi:MAG: diacylglycerol kinase [Planctomycetota bacterium]
MNDETEHGASVGGWRRKFACAFRGLVIGVRGESSFYVHTFATLAVLIVAAWLRLPSSDWLLLTLCTATVWSAELFNSALERLAKAITTDEHPDIRDALDLASGAVLAVAIGAAIVGLVLLGWPLLSSAAF